VLRHLQVRDLAVVAALDLDLTAGLSSLTGETGAGKSILVDALALALGERADAAAIRTGAERLEVSALFAVQALPAARAWLAASELDDGDDCLLRRVVGSDGRSRAWINGRPATVQSLRELGGLLVDICGQQEYQSLRQRANQRAVLDEHGGHGPLLARLAAAHAAATAARSELAALVAAGRDREARRELLATRLAELDALAPRAGEYAALADDVRRLAHRTRIAEALAVAVGRIEDDERGAAVTAIAAARRALDGIAALDPGVGPALALLDEAAIQLREAAGELRDRLAGLDADPAREARLADRLAALRDLARTLQVDPDALPAARAALADEFGQLDNLDDAVARLTARRDEADAALATVAAELTDRRRAAAGAFAAAVSGHLASLGLGGARFSVELLPRPDGEVAAHGAEDVEFRFSANPGQAPGPMARVASGGELSRLNLAIQVVAAAASPVGTLVFDEVDTGVGGAVAEIVGRRLRELAAHRQVLCITHLPQVAALADRQLTVQKATAGGHARTTVTVLDDAARVEELARMLGGLEITARTREHAREMLARGRAAEQLPPGPAAAGSAAPPRPKAQRSPRRGRT
jgi:DNA repair protein RecN (Recombination protein N)